jgi:hypothetical protein
MATVNTIKVTRSAVTTDDKMIGKKIQCADGEVRKIISVPSGSSYMVEGRSRISAHLVVKEGRAFVEIEPETLEGTVTAVRDMGGYARYTFAKKAAAKKEPKVQPKKDDKKPSTKKEPKVKPSTKKEPKADPAPKSEGKRNKKVADGVADAIAALRDASGLDAKIASKVLHGVLAELNAAARNANFDGSVTIEGDAVFQEEGGARVMLKIGFDLGNYYNGEEEEAEDLDVDQMLDALINGGFLTASQSRRMEDDEIVRKYNEHFSDEEEESELDTDFDPEDNENEDENEDFDPEDDKNEDFDPEDDKNEDENEEEEDEASYVEIDLPASCFEGLPRLPKNEATDLTNEMVEALELDALFPGVVFDYSHKDKELELAFVAFANNENGDPCMVMARVEDIEEERASIRRMWVSTKFAAKRLTVQEAEESEEGSDEDEDGFTI